MHLPCGRRRTTAAVASKHLILLTLVSAIFVFSHGAPPHHRDRQSPCSPRNKTRHGRSVSDTFHRAFITHRRNYSNTVKGYIKYIEKQENLGQLSKQQINMKKDWLRPLDFNENLSKLCPMGAFLSQFHDTIQVYAAAIDKLSKVNVQSQDNSFPEGRRSHMYKMLKAQLKLFLRECNTELLNRNMSNFTRTTTTRLSEAYESEIPDAISSKTDLLTEDYVVLIKYRQFLQDTVKSKRLAKRRHKKPINPKIDNNKKNRNRKKSPGGMKKRKSIV